MVRRVINPVPGGEGVYPGVTEQVGPDAGAGSPGEDVIGEFQIRLGLFKIALLSGEQIEQGGAHRLIAAVVAKQHGTLLRGGVRFDGSVRQLFEEVGFQDGRSVFREGVHLFFQSIEIRLSDRGGAFPQRGQHVRVEKQPGVVRTQSLEPLTVAQQSGIVFPRHRRNGGEHAPDEPSQE